MRTQTHFVLRAAMLLAVTAVSAHCQGTLVARHVGASDPTTEGFRALVFYGNQQLGPVMDDLGRDAWSIQVASSGMNYERRFPSLAGLDWIFSVTIRVLASDDSFYASINTGEYFFYLHFNTQADGDPMVHASGFSNATPVFVLDGAGSTYHNYQLAYTAAAETADFWIDGEHRFSGLIGGDGLSDPRLRWGGSHQPTTDQRANWNLVSLEIIPEPAVGQLLFAGGLLLVLRRRRARGCPPGA